MWAVHLGRALRASVRQFGKKAVEMVFKCSARMSVSSATHLGSSAAQCARSRVNPAHVIAVQAPDLFVHLLESGHHLRFVDQTEAVNHTGQYLQWKIPIRSLRSDQNPI